jgi:hypothetical protein
MSPEERERLIEEAVAAWRPDTRDGGPAAHPAWHDLDAGGRLEAYDRALAQRRVEAALSPLGLSTTGRSVLARIRQRK